FPIFEQRADLVTILPARSAHGEKPVVLEPRQTGVRAGPYVAVAIDSQRPYKHVRQAIARIKPANFAVRRWKNQSLATPNPQAVVTIGNDLGDEIRRQCARIDDGHESRADPLDDTAESTHPQLMLPVFGHPLDRGHRDIFSG